MHPLALLQNQPVLRLVGLMSGTSADGCDAVLCELSTVAGHLHARVLALHEEPVSDELRARILKAPDAHTAELCALNAHLGEWFAAAALGAIEKAGLRPTDVDAIGSHGQTVYHMPPSSKNSPGATLQLGEAAIIAERTGLPVVSNFRARDMAAGGQGAPLVPFADHALFASETVHRIALNIGGIANLTVLPAGGDLAAIRAYDTGPGNMVIDALVSRATRGVQAFDRNGERAAAGVVSTALLSELLDDVYFAMQPPKSTGRERYGAAYVERLSHRAQAIGLSTNDAIATATALTARSIALHICGEAARLEPGIACEVIVAGGGAFNPVLMAAIVDALRGVASVRISDELGVPVKAREALAFAILARETLCNRPGNVPSATGAAGPRILGQITLP